MKKVWFNLIFYLSKGNIFQLLYHILGDLGDVVNINVRNGSNQTPLHCAVTRNDLSQSFALLTYNADVNIANYEGDTPLHISVKVYFTFSKLRINTVENHVFLE